MPTRTKQRREPKVNSNSSDFNLLVELIDFEKILKAKLESEIDKMKAVTQGILKQAYFKFSEKELKKTLFELQNGNCTEISKLTDLSSIPNLTVQSSRSRHPQNSSHGEDEGYLTAGSGRIRSHSKSRIALNTTKKQTIRRTRSLSRSKAPKCGVNILTTPANKGNPQINVGTVTPKIKPNTPQVLLRRPKQGEMAISLQGSPLLVSGVMGESVANVNIPLNDGCVLSIQPQRGLRKSQLPNFSPSTLRQIETLRDNLTKVCSLTNKK